MKSFYESLNFLVDWKPDMRDTKKAATNKLKEVKRQLKKTELRHIRVNNNMIVSVRADNPKSDTEIIELFNRKNY